MNFQNGKINMVNTRIKIKIIKLIQIINSKQIDLRTKSYLWSEKIMIEVLNKSKLICKQLCKKIKSNKWINKSNSFKKKTMIYNKIQQIVIQIKIICKIKMIK